MDDLTYTISHLIEEDNVDIPNPFEIQYINSNSTLQSFSPLQE